MIEATRASGDRRVEVMLAASVIVVAFAAFAGTLAGGFVFDDVWIVRENPRVRDLARIGEILTTPYWGETASGLYRPVTLATFAVNHALHGLDAFGYHAVNVLLHAAVSLLVFRLARRWLPRGAAFGAALLFAVHPVHVEAVAGIVGRSDLLAAFFLLGALLTAVPGGSGERRKGGMGRWVAVSVLFALALGSKEIALAGLPLYLVLEAARGRGDRRTVAARAVWLLILTAGFLALKAAVTGSLGISREATDLVDNPLAHLPADERVLSAVRVLGGYAGLLLFPIRLSYDRSFDQIPVVETPWNAGFLVSAVLVIAVLVATGAAWRRSRAGFVGLAWLALAMLPVSNLLVPIGTIFAERLLYLPSVGFALAAAAALSRLAPGGAGSDRAGGGNRRRIGFLAAAILVLLAVRTVDRCTDWTSVDALYESGASIAPRSARTRCELGKLLYNRSLEASSVRSRRALEDRAIAELEAGVAIAPRFDPVARIALGYLYERRFRERDAARQFARAAEIAPRLPEARLLHLRSLARSGSREDLRDEVRRILADFPVEDPGADPAFWGEVAGLLDGLRDPQLESAVRSRIRRAARE
jgi:hypothetical protein